MMQRGCVGRYCVNFRHFFRASFLVCGFSERQEPKWFYLFIHSVHTSLVFFSLRFRVKFYSTASFFVSSLLSYWRKKPQCVR